MADKIKARGKETVLKGIRKLNRLSYRSKKKRMHYIESICHQPQSTWLADIDCVKTWLRMKRPLLAEEVQRLFHSVKLGYNPIFASSLLYILTDPEKGESQLSNKQEEELEDIQVRFRQNAEGPPKMYPWPSLDKTKH